MFSSRSSKDCQERNAELCLENSVVQPLLTDLYQITMVGISMLSFCILSLSAGSDFIFFLSSAGIRLLEVRQDK